MNISRVRTLIDMRHSVLPVRPPESLLNSLRASLGTLNRYPPPLHKLEKQIANFVEIVEERVIVTQGADGAIDLLVRALSGNSAVCTPTFAEYRAASERNGYCSRAISNVSNDNTSSIVLRSDERVLWMASPDNPSAKVLEPEFIRNLVCQLKPAQYLVVDETLVEFSSIGSSLSDLQSDERIVWVRSFSKAFGLAGLRIGFAIVPTGLAQRMRMLRRPFPVSALAIEAVKHVLKNPGYFKECWGQIRESCRELSTFLEKLGFSVSPPETNFVTVWFESPAQSSRFRSLLRNEGGLIVLGEDSNEFDTRGVQEGFARICLPHPSLMPRVYTGIKVSLGGLHS